MNRYKVDGKEYFCSVEVALDVFNDKWKLYIIWQLIKGPKRFKDLSKIVGITQKTLSVKLKELEEKGIIVRHAYAELPPRVEYTLSPLGKKLDPIIRHLYDWGIEYIKEKGEILTHKPLKKVEEYIQ